MLSPTEAYQLDLNGYVLLEGAFSAEYCAKLQESLESLEGRRTDELPGSCFASATPTVNEYRIYGKTPSTKYLKAVINLGPVGPDDGPMVLIEGSHRLTVPFPYSPIHADWTYPERDQAFREELLARIPDSVETVRWEDIPGYKEVHACTGDLVLFTEDLWHGAKYKRSPTPRRSLYFAYGPYHFPNWHDFSYSRELMERVTKEQRHLLAGPLLGNHHEDHRIPELADSPWFYCMPQSERFRKEPDYWRNDSATSSRMSRTTSRPSAPVDLTASSKRETS